jgi:hypothetical protein
MTVSLRLAKLTIAAAAILSASEASALHTSLAELLGRKPVQNGSPAELSGQKLEACLLRARDLDRAGNELDMQMLAIQDATGQAMFLQYLNRAQLPRLDNDDQAARDEFAQRSSHHDALRRKLDADVPIYEARFAAYEAGVKALERDCAGSFTLGDLEAAKLKLQIE